VTDNTDRPPEPDADPNYPLEDIPQMTTEEFETMKLRMDAEHKAELAEMARDADTPADKVYCLVCDKELELERHHTGDELIYDGGTMAVEFGYGSTHDCFGAVPDPDAPRHRWLTSGLVPLREAYLCDACFTARAHRVRGLRLDTSHPRRTELAGP
jgi:hypothetical protein